MCDRTFILISQPVPWPIRCESYKFVEPNEYTDEPERFATVDEAIKNGWKRWLSPNRWTCPDCNKQGYPAFDHSETMIFGALAKGLRELK